MSTIPPLEREHEADSEPRRGPEWRGGQAVHQRPPRLSYPADASRRDLRLDFIRGYCIFVMIVDHFPGFSSWLYVVTGHDQYIVSAREGFVLVSGIVMGLVYRPIVEQLGLEAMTVRALRRAGQIYLVAVGLALGLASLNQTVGLDYTLGWRPPIGDPLALVVGVVTLHQTWPLADIMLFYALAVAVAPLPLWLFYRGRTALALAGSWVLWAAYQVFPSMAIVPWMVSPAEGFPFSAWQLLFMNGLAVGYHRGRIAAGLRRLPHAAVFLALVVGLAGALPLYSYHSQLPPSLGGPANILGGELFHSYYLGPGRLLAAAIVFGLFYLVLSDLWRLISAPLGWLMLPLGQHALKAYTVHVFLVIAVQLLVREIPLHGLSTAEHTLIQTIVVLLTWGLVRRNVGDWVLRRGARRAAEVSA